MGSKMAHGTRCFRKDIFAAHDHINALYHSFYTKILTKNDLHLVRTYLTSSIVYRALVTIRVREDFNHKYEYKANYQHRSIVEQYN